MLINILIAILLAAVTYFLAGLFLPSPIPTVLALVVGLVALLRDRLNI